MTFQENNFPLDEPTDDPLELAVRAIRQESIPAGPSAETIAATLKALESREQSAQRTILSIPRSRMMKVVKTGSGLLLASCVAIAVLTLRSPASAYSQVGEQARQAKSMSYLETITTPETGRTAVVRKYVTADGRSRTEHMFNGKPSGTITITDPAGYIRASLHDASAMMPPGLAHLPAANRKTATLYPAREDRHPVEGGHANSWLRTLQSLQDKPDKELGEKELDGKMTIGFEATLNKKKVVMWVHAATGRPVQIDYDTLSHHITMTEFRFDENLDESLFSFDAPEGYEVRKAPTLPKAAGGEESLLIYLRGYTTESGGNYPTSISDWNDWITLVFKRSLEGKPIDESHPAMANIGAVTPFLSAMDKADYAYRGKGKTTQDKDAIVFWHKKPDGTYRAIYGDLRAKEIQATEVPKD